MKIMHRLPIPPERIAPSVLLLPGERHYLIDVLRLSPGDALEVFDGLGGRFPARIALADSRSSAAGSRETPVPSSSDVVLEIGERLPDEESGAEIGIAPALIKNDRLDWAIEKATELGASVIAPWEGRNCVVHLDAKKGAERCGRWQKLAQSAARQCGRAFIPSVLPPSNLEGILRLASERGSLCVVLYERETENALTQVVLKERDPSRPILVVTGPEGGFREEEIALCRENGAVTASLGRRILRAETAPIAALAAIRAVRGEM